MNESRHLVDNESVVEIVRRMVYEEATVSVWPQGNGASEIASSKAEVLDAIVKELDERHHMDDLWLVRQLQELAQKTRLTNRKVSAILWVVAATLGAKIAGHGDELLNEFAGQVSEWGKWVLTKLKDADRAKG